MSTDTTPRRGCFARDMPATDAPRLRRYKVGADISGYAVMEKMQMLSGYAA